MVIRKGMVQGMDRGIRKSMDRGMDRGMRKGMDKGYGLLFSLKKRSDAKCCGKDP